MRLGNRTNLPEASKAGGASMAREADAFASNVLTVIEGVRASSKRSLCAIADELNARRIETARGGTWSAMQVTRVMERA